MSTIYDDPPHGQVLSTPDGRVTIPVQVRRMAGVEPGQTLMVYVEDGRIIFEEREHLLARLQDEAISASVAAGHTGSVADELIADRRAAAVGEAAEA